MVNMLPFNKVSPVRLYKCDFNKSPTNTSSAHSILIFYYIIAAVQRPIKVLSGRKGRRQWVLLYIGCTWFLCKMQKCQEHVRRPQIFLCFLLGMYRSQV